MYNPSSILGLSKLFADFATCKIGVLGDFCVDAYWTLDTGERETSIETGKPTYAVRQQSYSLGGAGNIVSNLASIGVSQIFCLGVIGDDLFGREMQNQLAAIGANHSYLLAQASAWDTPVYGKPYWGEEELDRLDFGRFNTLSPESEDELIEQLQTLIPQLDVLLLNHQLPQSIYGEKLWKYLIETAKSNPSCRIIVDFRHLPNQIEGMWVKLNATEAARYCGQEGEGNSELSACKTFAHQIFSKSGKPVMITRSERGILTYDGTEYCEIPGIHITQPIDIVGAGDTTLSGFAASIACGASLRHAAELANFAAAVSIQKLQQTGTASPEEIKEIAQKAQFIYAPEVAEDVRKAQYWEDSEIEMVNGNIDWGKVRWAIFDHDGTISVLREGWEPIMERMMMQSILGEHYTTASTKELASLKQQIHQYIMHSAGMQTVDQMRWLAEQVKEYGFIPSGQILSAEAYKALFLEDLLAHTKKRTDRVQNGELSVADVTIKGAVDCLKRFDEERIELVLLSGTDHEYVIQEAELLDYSHFFKGRIYGALEHSNKHEKGNVMKSISEDNGLIGQELLALGDGPNEIRAIKKLGGIAIGIASDEVRRYGMNLSKRKRLIQAGADVIISDFSQWEKLSQLVLDRK